MSSCLGGYFWGAGVVGVVTEIFYVIFFFNLESEVINATVGIASSPFTVSAVTDHGLPHGFW